MDVRNCRYPLNHLVPCIIHQLKNLPCTLSARDPAGATVPRLSKTDALWGRSPCTDSSLLRWYTVAIVAEHLSFMSPFLKCLGLTANSRPNIEVSRPSRPVTMTSGPRRNFGSAGSPLIYQLSWAAGLDRPEVQFTWTISPIW